MNTTNIFRFHLGTAVLGSMILTIFQGIKTIIYAVKKLCERLGYYSGNFWFDCFIDIFAILEFVLQYVNNYAYIVCSIHGTNFFHSTRHVYNLIKKNVILTLSSSLVKEILSCLILIRLHYYYLFIIFFFCSWQQYSFFPFNYL